jgi:hypothetical protein
MPPMFCLCWDDLYPPTGGGVWYKHDAANHRFIIEYDSVPPYRAQTTYQKFELILYDTTLAARDGNCVAVAQYQLVPDFTSCTVGEQDPTQSVAIQCLYDGTYHRAAAPIAAGRATKYTTDYGTGLAEGAESGVRRLMLAVGPNPTSAGRVVFDAALPAPTQARIALYDATGRLVRTLPVAGGGRVAAGRYAVAWDGCDGRGRSATTGIYLARLLTDGGRVSTKVVLTK